VAFLPDGGYIVIQGAHATVQPPTGGAGGFALNPSFAFSSVAAGNGAAYATFGDGSLYQFYYGGSGGGAIGQAGCAVPPVFARGVVYAASCNSIGAYDADTLQAKWSITPTAPPTGLAVANGVLYACQVSRVVAYAASYGGRLSANIAPCAGAVEIAQGTVFSTTQRLYAATLDGASATVASPQPDPRSLRPTR
jgi:hypothetical protein